MLIGKNALRHYVGGKEDAVRREWALDGVLDSGHGE